MTSINFTAEEWENFYVNCRPLYHSIRISLSNFVSDLLKLRTSLYKTLISFDAYSKYFSPHHIKPEQVKDYLQAITCDKGMVTPEELWGVKVGRE